MDIDVHTTALFRADTYQHAKQTWSFIILHDWFLKRTPKLLFFFCVGLSQDPIFMTYYSEIHSVSNINISSQVRLNGQYFKEAQTDDTIVNS